MKSYKFLKKILIIMIAVAFSLCVGYYFLFQNIITKNKSVSEMQSNIKNQIERDEYIKSIQTIVQTAQNDIDKINNSIITRDDDIGFIEKLESIAKNNGLEITIESISVDNLTSLSKTNMTTLNISARTKGSWAGTYAFLNQLESMSYILRVDKFGIMNISDNSSGSKQIWQTVFEIHILKNK